MKKSSTRSLKPHPLKAASLPDLEFPDWSGSRRGLPRVGWEEIHRHSEMLLRASPHKPRRATVKATCRAEFVL